jgi:hypothetical protein
VFDVFSPKFTLEYLAVGISRQALAPHHATDTLLLADPRIGPVEQLGSAHACPGCSTTTASGVSPQRSLGIPITAASATAGCSTSRSRCRRIDVLPAGEDHVLLAIDDVEKVLRIEPAEVAGAQPLGAGRVEPGCLPVRLVRA